MQYLISNLQFCLNTTNFCFGYLWVKFYVVFLIFHTNVLQCSISHFMLLYHKHLNYQGSSEILILISITIMFFWNVTSSSLVNNYDYLEGICYLHIHDRRVNNIGKSVHIMGKNNTKAELYICFIFKKKKSWQYTNTFSLWIYWNNIINPHCITVISSALQLEF